jgi:hypothetical protein
MPTTTSRLTHTTHGLRVAASFNLRSERFLTDHKDVDTRRPLTKNVLSCFCLESRFYAVFSKAASSGLALNPRRSKSRELERPKAAKVFE